MPAIDPERPTLDEFLSECHQGKTLIEHVEGYGYDREHARATITAVRVEQRQDWNGRGTAPYVFIETDNEDAHFEGLGLTPESCVGGVWRLDGGRWCRWKYSILPLPEAP